MLKQILELAKEQIASVLSLELLGRMRVEFLGKQSAITQEMKKLGTMDPDERKAFGEQINRVRDEIAELLRQKQELLEAASLQERLQHEWTDLSLPSRSRKIGSLHPITECTEELVQIFAKYGFTIKDGPNIETDWYNFTALGIDENHPARQMHDTFYLKGGQVLRTHTSPVQIRTMQAEKPPFKFIAPGRTYRSDSDMTHTPMFHQIEGLYVDEGVHMGHLKHVITGFIKDFFEQDNIEVRFRPCFFPFTEPSAEVDIRLVGSSGWLEVLGCGMVHPKVLTNAGVDPEKYQGFAFGLGVERFAMLKYGMKDLREFFAGDYRWLSHYNFTPSHIPTIFGGLSK